MESELLTSSNSKIPPEDWALTPPTVQRTMLQILDRVAALEEELSSLRIENERLREQTKRSSRNSSQPPSSDTPNAPPRNKRESSGKKRGAQPGHEGHQRKLYPPEECRSVNDHRPTECRTCGTALSGDDPNPVRHQVVELPEAPPLVEEHRLHQLTCPECGEATRARLPPDVPASGYGARLAAALGLLGGKYRQSERQSQGRLEDFFRVEVALGTVNNLRQEVSASLAAPVEEATKFAQAQKAANADETGWRQGNSDGNNPTQRKAWWWVMVTSWVTVFQVHLSRGQTVAGQVRRLPDHGSVDRLWLVAAESAAIVLGASDPRIPKDHGTWRRIASDRRRIAGPSPQIVRVVGSCLRWHVDPRRWRGSGRRD
jgi:transposase